MLVYRMYYLYVSLHISSCWYMTLRCQRATTSTTTTRTTTTKATSLKTRKLLKIVDKTKRKQEKRFLNDNIYKKILNISFYIETKKCVC